MEYGKHLLEENVYDEDSNLKKDGDLFKYNFIATDLTVIHANELKLLLDTVTTLDYEIKITINTDEVKKRIRMNTLNDHSLNLDENTCLKNVLEYQLVTKPSVTFK